MASASSKTPCVTCGKGSTGLFKCEGCTQTFCTKHVVEHRQTLHHQLDDIIIKHDTLQETINKNKDQCHPLLDYIHEWERKSIEKIQQMAKETRQNLAELANVHKGRVSEELNLLTKRIKKAREEDDFFETDLNNWMLTLDQLKQELTNGPLSNNIQEDQSVPFIYQLKLVTTSSEFNNKTIFKHHASESKMRDSGDIFERCLDGATIADNGRLVVYNKLFGDVEVRGKVGYASGIHRFRLQIEKNPSRKWIFFGIISKSTPMTQNSYNSSSAYGWADYNDFFLAGIRQNKQGTGSFSHTLEKDIISLEFDCDDRKISYTNERSQQNKQQLNIDINKCPFPWQLHVNLCGKDDRVRLLSALTTL